METNIELTEKFIDASATDIRQALIDSRAIVVCAVTYRENGKAGVIIAPDIKSKELDICIDLLKQHREEILDFAASSQLINDIG